MGWGHDGETDEVACGCRMADTRITGVRGLDKIHVITASPTSNIGRVEPLFRPWTTLKLNNILSQMDQESHFLAPETKHRLYNVLPGVADGKNKRRIINSSRRD